MRESSANRPANVLLVDDEEHIRLAAEQALDLSGFAVHCLDNASAALTELDCEFPGVVVSDIKMPGMDGLTLLDRALKIDPDLPVILITGHGDVSMAVDAMRNGAYDFIEKPFSSERLVDTVRRALEKRRLTMENRCLRRELDAQSALGPRIIGRTPVIQRLRGLIAQIANTDADVLVYGETGTGKELVARALHEQSDRRHRHFVAVNCGAVPEHLLETELFGHEAGAFTGAKTRRIGKFEHANGGTLLLDEIESMPLQAQVHLLRVLQERVVERIGANTLVPLDLRIVAASKINLREAATRGEFREDLYYRLSVVNLNVPALRERPEDIPMLFHHFLLVASARYGREVPAPKREQLHRLINRDWPGNVRELRNAAERYVLFGEDQDNGLASDTGEASQRPSMSLPEQVECFERSLIEEQLVAHHGSIKDTMAALGLPRKTLYDKMKKYGLEKADFD